MILISGFLYAWFVQMILAHFGVQAGYWLCYGMIMLLACIISDSNVMYLKSKLNKLNRD